MTTSATAKLIRFIHDTAFSDLSPQAVQDTKRLIADTIACALGARQLEAARIVTGVAADLGGPGTGGAPVSILGTSWKASPAAATSANMYLGNLLDADDTYLNFSHPAIAAVFPALAFAESLGLSGKDCIAAVALGYEVGCRVGAALEFVRQTESGELKAVTGNVAWYSFCVAGAAGKALGLNPSQFNNAFGLAGWTALIPTGQFYVPLARPGKHMLKYAPVGFQGLNGVLAAQLARKGFVAEQDIFDAPEEFWVSFGVLGLNRDRMLAGLGHSWQVSETSLKPYSCGRYAHHALRLFLGLMERHTLHPEEIDNVVVRTFDRGVNWLGVNYAPQTPLDMEFSIPLAIAAAAYGSDLGPSWLSAQSMADQRQLAFARKVQVEGHPDTGPVLFQQIMAEGRFRRIPHEVRIAARGTVFSASGDSAWGDPWSEETRMTDSEVKHKFRTYAAAALPPTRSEEALDVIFNLEQVKNVAVELAPTLQPN